MSSKTRSLLVAFAFLGLIASTISSYVHYQLLTEPNYSSFCDVSTRVSCTEAYVSRYGSFMGVPVAVGGVIFFAIAALLAGFAGRAGVAGARECRRLCLRAVDRRSRLRPVSRLGVLRSC